MFHQILSYSILAFNTSFLRTSRHLLPNPFYTCESIFYREYQNSSLLNSSLCFQRWVFNISKQTEELQPDWLKELFFNIFLILELTELCCSCARYMFRYYLSLSVKFEIFVEFCLVDIFFSDTVYNFVLLQTLSFLHTSFGTQYNSL